jgi:hypothetical protein
MSFIRLAVEEIGAALWDAVWENLIFVLSIMKGGNSWGPQSKYGKLTQCIEYEDLNFMKSTESCERCWRRQSKYGIIMCNTYRIGLFLKRKIKGNFFLKRVVY